MVNKEKKTKVQMKEGNPTHIGYRVWELAETQKTTGLNFQILEGDGLDSVAGMNMVISNPGIILQRGDVASMPEEHRKLLAEQNMSFDTANCINIKSSGAVDRELAATFVFGERLSSGQCNVTMIRMQGGSKLITNYCLDGDTIFFIVANKVSLTAKIGTLTNLFDAGIEIDPNWESNVVPMLQ